MSLRLDIELALRRYGWRALVLPAVSMVALLWFIAQSDGPGRQEIVPATEGSRQRTSHYRAFRDILIPRQELEARQREVLETALSHGLVADRIDYGLTHNESGRFDVATVQLPLRGNYADFRAFLFQVLAAQPALSVVDLAVRSTTAGATEARLTLAFHVAPAREGSAR